MGPSGVATSTAVPEPRARTHAVVPGRHSEGEGAEADDNLRLDQFQLTGKERSAARLVQRASAGCRAGRSAPER